MTASQLTPDEFHSYYKPYIDLIKDMPLLTALPVGMTTTAQYFRAIPEAKQEFRYEEGKWTPKEILLHLIDTERVFSYRALLFARSKNPEIHGFDQDEFVDNCGANHRSMEDLVREYESVRTATLTLFSSFDDATLMRRGKANGVVLSARAAGFIVGGHEIHHCRIITERYL
jgi:hypothetical protein